MRLKLGFFRLRRVYGAEHLAGGGIVKFYTIAAAAHGFQKPYRPQRSHIARIFWYVETHAHVALRAQMINLARPYIVNQVVDLFGVGQVAEMKE